MLFHLYNNPVGSHYPTFLNEKPGAPKSDKLFRVDGWLVVAEQALTDCDLMETTDYGLSNSGSQHNTY